MTFKPPWLDTMKNDEMKDHDDSDAKVLCIYKKYNNIQQNAYLLTASNFGQSMPGRLLFF